MPSGKHTELIEKALVWLGNRATGKGIASAREVGLVDGYVADAAALFSWQWRFIDKYECEKPKYWQQFSRDKELNYFSGVFEVKVSRSDFQKTFGNGPKHENRKTPVAVFHWVVTPKGLVNPGEVPDFWGLLQESAGGLSEKKRPKMKPDQQSIDRLDNFAHRLIWPMRKARNRS